MSTTSLRPHGIVVSMASRVVPGRLRHDRPLLAQQRVEQARLADVRPADERDRRRLVVLGRHLGVPAGGDASASDASRRRRVVVLVVAVVVVLGLVGLARRRTAPAARSRPPSPRPRPRPRGSCGPAPRRSRAAAPTRRRRAGRRRRARGWPRSRTSPPSRTRRTRRRLSSRCSLSALLAATSTGLVVRRRSSAASWSAGVGPVAASTRNTMTSASLIASRAWSWTCSSIGSPGAISRPPVSTTTNRRPFHSASP